MKETEHYQLKKPDPNDYAKIETLNENADRIDAALAAVERSAANHAGQHSAGGSDPVTPAAIGAATADDLAGKLSLSGGTLTGYIDFDQGLGRATVFKNASTTADFGLTIRDYSEDGKAIGLVIHGTDQKIAVQRNNGGGWHEDVIATAADLADKMPIIFHDEQPPVDLLSPDLPFGWHRSNNFVHFPPDAIDGQGDCLVIYYAGTVEYWGTRIFKEPHGYRAWINQSLGPDGWMGWVKIPDADDLAAITPASIGASALSHAHDDRYFTESECLSASTAALLGGCNNPDSAFAVLKGLVDGKVTAADIDAAIGAAIGRSY